MVVKANTASAMVTMYCPPAIEASKPVEVSTAPVSPPPSEPVASDAFRFGLYTGMRQPEVFGLEWAHVDMAARVLRIEYTKSGKPLAFPVTRQLTAILERRRADRDRLPMVP